MPASGLASRHASPCNARIQHTALAGTSKSSPSSPLPLHPSWKYRRSALTSPPFDLVRCVCTRPSAPCKANICCAVCVSPDVPGAVPSLAEADVEWLLGNVGSGAGETLVGASCSSWEAALGPKSSAGGSSIAARRSTPGERATTPVGKRPGDPGIITGPCSPPAWPRKSRTLANTLLWFWARVATMYPARAAVSSSTPSSARHVATSRVSWVSGDGLPRAKCSEQADPGLGGIHAWLGVSVGSACGAIQTKRLTLLAGASGPGGPGCPAPEASPADSLGWSSPGPASDRRRSCRPASWVFLGWPAVAAAPVSQSLTWSWGDSSTGATCP
mmetsp:Transcript_124647/g.285526  ORF Transcript_124647/g.285526 Transcript_124647/m.285526 type:complete len:330 (-) Transcript_124647:2073-3062(-)